MKDIRVASNSRTGKDDGKRFTAKRSLGQNFLVDTGVVQRIIREFAPKTADIVIEIGPGRGALTEKLIGHVAAIHALEFDTRLTAALTERFAPDSSLTAIEGDALTFDFRQLVDEGQKLRLLANLPYNISTAILQRLCEFGPLFSDCTLMFQREVADRITAAPGTKDRGYLTLRTEANFDVVRLFDVPPEAFWPVPKVWSSVVRLTPAENHIEDEPMFLQVIATGFSQKRKTILNNLKPRYAEAAASLEAAGIDPRRRAETLLLEEWIRLAYIIRETQVNT